MSMSFLVEEIFQLRGIDQVAIMRERDPIGAEDVFLLAYLLTDCPETGASPPASSRIGFMRKAYLLTKNGCASELALVPAVGYRR